MPRMPFMPHVHIRKADFPKVADLASVPGMDTYDASNALAVLYQLACADLAKVYIPAGWHDAPRGQPQRWNVWLEITQRRVELTAWASEWLAMQGEQEQQGQNEQGDANQEQNQEHCQERLA